MATLTQFTPSEAEAITGVKAVRQRELRRQHLIGSWGNSAHNRFDAYGLVHLWSFELLGAQGIPATDVNRTTQIQVQGMATRLPLIVAAGTVFHAISNSQGATLARGIHRRHILGNMRPRRFLICFPNGLVSWEDSLDKAIGNGKHDPSNLGALVVLDQQQLGATLVERAGRPLVEIA